MVSRLVYVTAIVLALGGCASSGYDDGGYYSPYPAQTYYGYNPDYYDGPYYPYGPYGAYGYGSNFDHDFDHHPHRFFHPDRDVTCDRRTRTCFDDDRVNPDLTDKFFGKHSGRQMGNTVVQPTPPRATSNKGSVVSIQPNAPMNRPNQPENDAINPAMPRMNTNDKHVNRPILLPQQSMPQGLMDNEDNGVPPRSTGQSEQSDQSNRPAARPAFAPLNNDKVQGNNGVSGGSACPPRGCSNK